MPKFSANLSMLFTERDFLDRFEAAAKAGFPAVEYLGPYDFPKEEVAARLKTNGLKQVLFNLPSGDWGKGERGIACHPDRVAEFRAGVARAIDYAHALDCPTINCLAGIRSSNASVAEAHRTLVENLRYAAGEMQREGILLIAEPINYYDIPGFFLNHSAQTLAILDEAGAPNLKLQYDIYHMQRMEGELAATMEKHLKRIGHIQIAGNPGRNEPDIGEINYPYLMQRLDALGYDGWVGAEYKPKGRTEDGLDWLRAWGGKA
jgi:hydroxypyruvate isomerase